MATKGKEMNKILRQLARTEELLSPWHFKNFVECYDYDPDDDTDAPDLDPNKESDGIVRTIDGEWRREVNGSWRFWKDETFEPIE